MWVASGSGVPVDPFTPSQGWINAANNRLVNAGQGIGYDVAGNQTSIGGFAWAYDAENRLKTAVQGTVTTEYSYDGDGRRVKKVQGSATTVYVYDAGGNLAAEYATQPETPLCTTCYLTADHLGSTRLMTDGSSGAAVALHDYLPFGEEIPAGIGGRSSLYGTDSPRQRFTGKERDSETSLDYFGARYLSSAQGRFTSVDPIGIMKRKLVDPQQWNMYSYARNNPLRFTDPTGTYVCSDSEKCDSKKDKAFDLSRQRNLKSKDPAVVAAARVYGEPRTANGVSVAFAKTLPGGCAGGAGCTQAGITGTASGIAPDVKVTFSDNVSGRSLDQAVAHEGSHTADALQFINSFDASTGKFNGAFNYVHYDTEFKAYAIGASVRSGEAYTQGTCGGSPCVFGANDSIQDTYRRIDQMLTDPESRYRPDLEKLQFDPSIYPQ
jgi:RHS repeat-associated protein